MIRSVAVARTINCNIRAVSILASTQAPTPTPTYYVHRASRYKYRYTTIRCSDFHSSPSPAMMGIFDDAKNFLSGLLVRAQASHILIKGTDADSEQKIHEIQMKLLEQEFESSSSDDHDNISTNANNLATLFANAAALHSDCPSGRSRGGSLGEFGRFSMVPEFDKVVFNKDSEVGVVHGPIQTSFGYHLILIASRSDTTPTTPIDVTTTTTTPDEK